MNKQTGIILFKEKSIRRVWYKNEWWFVIIDVISAVTDSLQPTGYIKDMRRRDPELQKGWRQIATPLPVETGGGMPENKKVAQRGGKVAGNARKETEKELGEKVISQKNYVKRLDHKTKKHRQ